MGCLLREITYGVVLCSIRRSPLDNLPRPDRGALPPTASHTVDGVAISRLDVVRRWTARATIVLMLLLAKLSRMGPQSQRYGCPAVWQLPLCPGSVSDPGICRPSEKQEPCLSGHLPHGLSSRQCKTCRNVPVCCKQWHSGRTHQMPIGAVGNQAKTGCAECGPSSNPPLVCYGST